MRLFFLLVMLAGPVAAQEQVYRLSPADRDAAIAKAAMAPERPAVQLTPEVTPAAGLQPSAQREAILGSSLYGDVRPDRRPHGEVGVFVGSGGTRGFFGTTAVPLGDSGMASFSFNTGRFQGFGPGFGPVPPRWQLNGGDRW
jgi:hypothetical protein